MCIFSPGIPFLVLRCNLLLFLPLISDKAPCAEFFTFFFFPTHSTTHTYHIHRHAQAVVLQSLLLWQYCLFHLGVSLDGLNKMAERISTSLVLVAATLSDSVIMDEYVPHVCVPLLDTRVLNTLISHFEDLCPFENHHIVTYYIWGEGDDLSRS